MSPQLETQGPGSSRCGRPGVGVGGACSRGWQGGRASWARRSSALGTDRQPESRLTSVMRNIPKQEFCLLQNHCSFAR